VGQAPSIVAIVGQLVSGRMPEHVWVNLERKVRGLAGPLERVGCFQHPARSLFYHRGWLGINRIQ
jgi:hypothetical protein